MYEKKDRVWAESGGYQTAGGLWDVISQIGSGLGSGLSAAANYGQQPGTAPAVGTPEYTAWLAATQPQQAGNNFGKYVPWIIGGAGVLGLIYFTTKKRKS